MRVSGWRPPLSRVGAQQLREAVHPRPLATVGLQGSTTAPGSPCLTRGSPYLTRVNTVHWWDIDGILVHADRLCSAPGGSRQAGTIGRWDREETSLMVGGQGACRMGRKR